ncbi:dimethylsulfonioproprionate lyase family protein [Azospirillum doebereinerae]
MTAAALADGELLVLLRLMRTTFAAGLGRAPAVAAEAARVLADLPDGRGPVPLAAALLPNHHPSLEQLPEAARRAGPAWAKALPPVAGRLPWRFGYAPRADLPELQNRMAWAEIVGPAAPIRSDRVGFGLTLIGRDTHYPSHRHPAVELYAVVSGTAAWTLDGVTTQRPPGDVVLHPANAVHAMRTTDEPLLALYSWTGDIVSPTAYT